LVGVWVVGFLFVFWVFGGLLGRGGGGGGRGDTRASGDQH
jgi:hypothetical protein